MSAAQDVDIMPVDAGYIEKDEPSDMEEFMDSDMSTFSGHEDFDIREWQRKKMAPAAAAEKVREPVLAAPKPEPEIPIIWDTGTFETSVTIPKNQRCEAYCRKQHLKGDKSIKACTAQNIPGRCRKRATYVLNLGERKITVAGRKDAVLT